MLHRRNTFHVFEFKFPIAKNPSLSTEVLSMTFDRSLQYSSHPETRPSGQRSALFKIVPDDFVA